MGVSPVTKDIALRRRWPRNRAPSVVRFITGETPTALNGSARPRTRKNHRTWPLQKTPALATPGNGSGDSARGHCDDRQHGSATPSRYGKKFGAPEKPFPLASDYGIPGRFLAQPTGASYRRPLPPLWRIPRRRAGNLRGRASADTRQLVHAGQGRLGQGRRYDVPGPAPFRWRRPCAAHVGVALGWAREIGFRVSATGALQWTP